MARNLVNKYLFPAIFAFFGLFLANFPTFFTTVEAVFLLNNKNCRISYPRMILWQDREVRFDIEPEEVKERPGEEFLAILNPVEDTKGNNGMRGILKISNLRVVWITPRTNSLNLSIGLKSVVDVKKKNAQSKLRGVITALHLTAKGPSTRYEVYKR